MRLLISTLDASSHLRALVPVALAARAAGHEVMVTGPADLAAAVTGDYGLDFRPTGVDWTEDAVTSEAIGRTIAFGAHDDHTATLVNRVFLGKPALSAAADIVELAESWRPDVVLRVAEETGSYLAAEALGIPHAAVASGNTHVLTPDRIAGKLGSLRASFGLPADGDPYPYLLASFTFQGYSPELDAIGTLRHYRQPQAARRGERLPDWLAGSGYAWPPAGKPLVFAAFGSVMPGVSWKTGPIIAAVLKALNDLDCAAVLAAGPVAAELSGAAGPLVRVVETAPQPLLIEAADLFITHAGFGSVREALRAGTPMVAIPIIGDQPYHAARGAELGVAKALRAGASPAVIGRACAEVLDPGAGYKAAARRVQRTCLALPPVDDLVEDLAALTRAAGLGITRLLRHSPRRRGPGGCCRPGLVVRS